MTRYLARAEFGGTVAALLDRQTGEQRGLRHRAKAFPDSLIRLMDFLADSLRDYNAGCSGERDRKPRNDGS
jgi:hypothetical protein